MSFAFRDMHSRPSFIIMTAVDVLLFCLVAALVACVPAEESLQNLAYLVGYLLFSGYELCATAIVYCIGFRYGIRYVNVIMSLLLVCFMAWGIIVCFATWASSEPLLYYPCVITLVYCVLKHCVIVPHFVGDDHVGAMLDHMAAGAEAREPLLDVEGARHLLAEEVQPSLAKDSWCSDNKEEVAQTLGGDVIRIKPAGCKGLGAFAAAAIPADRYLECYGGEHRLDEEVAISSSAYLFSLGGGRCIDAAEGCEGITWTRYINHARAHRANCVARVCFGPATAHCIVTDDGSWIDAEVPPGPRVEIWTTRPIQAGEELIFDYGREYADHLKRECEANGSPFVE